METYLSANREITDYANEDAFNFKIKADAIKSFLENNVLTIMQNKMMALYGDWGSGKTSMMRCIEKEINKGIYFPIFFHAWEFEKDENLALSLCDVMTESVTDSQNPVIKTFKENAIHMLKGFFSGTTVKLGGTLLGAEIEFDGSKIVEGFDKSKSSVQVSHFTQKTAFKETFKTIEELILRGSEATRIIVFVDDLDRCEPENVLNLITALKLFFTYGEHTVFMAGLDKEAVNKAVLTKYKDVVKSEEYLEKVFDITFSVPRIFSLQKFLSNYFKGDTIIQKDEILDNVAVIDHFFKSIHFTNPRKIKKVLNKYQILIAFKKSSATEEVNNLIPNILDKDGAGNLFETILCLFFIILYEHYPNEFDEVEHYNRKFKLYIEPFTKQIKVISPAAAYSSSVSSLNSYQILDVENKTIEQTFEDADRHIQIPGFDRFLLIFSSSKPKSLGTDFVNNYGDYFQDSGILTLFCKFLIKHKMGMENNVFSNYILWNYFAMAKYLL